MQGGGFFLVCIATIARKPSSWPPSAVHVRHCTRYMLSAASHVRSNYLLWLRQRVKIPLARITLCCQETWWKAEGSLRYINWTAEAPIQPRRLSQVLAKQAHEIHAAPVDGRCVTAVRWKCLKADVIIPAPSSSTGRVGTAAPAGQPHPRVFRQCQNRKERQLIALCEFERLCSLLEQMYREYINIKMSSFFFSFGICQKTCCKRCIVNPGSDLQ